MPLVDRSLCPRLAAPALLPLASSAASSNQLLKMSGGEEDIVITGKDDNFLTEDLVSEHPKESSEEICEAAKYITESLTVWKPMDEANDMVDLEQLKELQRHLTHYLKSVDEIKDTEMDKLNRDLTQHREDGSTTCSSEEVPFDENQRRIGEKPVVFLSKEIGQGTDETVVYEGSYEGRPVAVRCLRQSHIRLADQEIQNQIATDHGQNIVRYHGVEQDKDFVYLAPERCDCSLDDHIQSLDDLIKIYSVESFDQCKLVLNDIHYSMRSVTLNEEDCLENQKNTLGDVKLYKEINGHPSPLLLKLMWDMVSGLAYLHGLCMVHQDLKPQNVLIIKGSSTLCAKLSDMGISKRLVENKSSLSNHFSGCTATGWKAPEQLLHGRQTSVTDLFSLCCIRFYTIALGRHPFGDHEHDENSRRKNKLDLFLTEDIPEAFHLNSSLLKADPEVRPRAIEVLRHPFFWGAEKRLSFLGDTSDRVINNNALFKAMESTACPASDAIVKQDMSGFKDLFDSLQPRDIVISAEGILKRLKENPTPQTTELLKKFLRDVQKCHREDTSTTCSSEEVPFDKNQRRIGEKLVVFLSKEIGQGTNGTVVYEGSYDGRPVAVKRLLQSHIRLADQEIQNLIATDHGQSIVRYHGVEQDKDFVYLALERCDCSLDDLIKIYSAESFDQYEIISNDIHYSTRSVTLYEEDRLENLKNILGDVMLYKENNGHPSPLLLKLMRDMVSGLVHLHGLRMVHRDLKPQNVLIIKGSSTLCAKLSDMGISKRLVENKSSLSKHFFGSASTGWQAPEQLLHGRQTSAMDLFSLGCILFYIITRGRHPFGDHERNENIKRKRKPDLFLIENFPEAFHLISLLLKADPEVRPTAIEVLRHPFFWDAEKRLSFLRDTSDRVINNNALFKAIESTACAVLGTTLKGKVLAWDKKLDGEIITHRESCSERDYKFGSVRDLLRLIRNIFVHYGRQPEDIQMLVGPSYEVFDDYFTSRFPMLLLEVYKVVRTCCGEEECFRKYFEGNL